MRGIIGRGRGVPAPVAFDLEPNASKQPVFASGALAFEGESAEVVPLLVRRDKAWFSVIERPAPAAAGRARLVERDVGGQAKVVASQEVNAPDTQRPSLYAAAGNIAVVALGASVYGFMGRDLLLDGPGADRDLFAEHDDAHCPPRKHCFRIPPKYDLTKLVGVAPNGSFVTVDSGVVLRVDARGASAYHYQTYTSHGTVGDRDVTLAHVGEPPEVVRWSPPPTPKPPPKRPPAGSSPAIEPGIAKPLGQGAFEALTEDGSGDVYGVRSDGALVQLSGASAGVLYAPSDGCRATSALGKGDHAIAWVVSCARGDEPGRHYVLTK